MSSATQPAFVKDAWQTPRNARTLQAFMALRNEEIAQRIKALRAAKGDPPQTLVAHALGVGERTYQTWENGEAKPGYANLQRLAAYYGVGEDFILTGSDRDQEPTANGNNHRTAQLAQILENHTAIFARLDGLDEQLRLINAALVGLAGAAVAQAPSTAEQGEGAEGQATQGHRP